MRLQSAGGDTPHKEQYQRNIPIQAISERSSTLSIRGRRLAAIIKKQRRNIPIQAISERDSCAFIQPTAARRNYKEIAKKYSHIINIEAQQYAFNQVAETLRIKSNCEEIFPYGLHRSVAVAPSFSRRRLAARIFAPSFSYCRVWKSGGSKERNPAAPGVTQSGVSEWYAMCSLYVCFVHFWR